MTPITIRCAGIEDASAIRAIYVPYIATSITFEEEAPTEEDFAARVTDVLERYPFLVAEDEGQVIGFAYAHEQAERAAYRWNVELSIYLGQRCGRKGLGTVMYRTLIELLKLQGYRRAYARVTMPNAASKRLHNKLGFKVEWVQKRAGFKAGCWRDVVWFSKQLLPQSETAGEHPAEPLSLSEVGRQAIENVLAPANALLERYAAKPQVSATTRKTMQANKGMDTKPELEVRRMLRELGFPGYRLHWKQCPGRPDIAYPGRKLAIFVHGCFWHACPQCNLSKPKTNSQFWNEKFERNVARDRKNQEELEAAGWKVVTIWEHDLTPEKREETSRYLYEAMTL